MTEQTPTNSPAKKIGKKTGDEEGPTQQEIDYQKEREEQQFESQLPWEELERGALQPPASRHQAALKILKDFAIRELQQLKMIPEDRLVESETSDEPFDESELDQLVGVSPYMVFSSVITLATPSPENKKGVLAIRGQVGSDLDGSPRLKVVLATFLRSREGHYYKDDSCNCIELGATEVERLFSASDKLIAQFPVMESKEKARFAAGEQKDAAKKIQRQHEIEEKQAALEAEKKALVEGTFSAPVPPTPKGPAKGAGGRFNRFRK